MIENKSKYIGCLTDLRNFLYEKTQLFNYYFKTKGLILKLSLNNSKFFRINFADW